MLLLARPNPFGKTPPSHYRPEPPSTRPLDFSRFLLFHCSVDLQKDKAGSVRGPGNRSQSSQIQIWCNKRQIAVAGRGRPPATFISLSEPANHEFGSDRPTPICCLLAQPIAGAAGEAARDKGQCINSSQQPPPPFRGSSPLLGLPLTVQDMSGYVQAPRLHGRLEQSLIFRLG